MPSNRKQMVNGIRILLVLLLLISMLELTARSMYTTRSDLYYLQSKFELYAPKVKLLILGSSHAAQSVNPAFVGVDSFNLSHSYRDIYYDKEIFKAVFPRLPKLKQVLLEVSPFAFEYEMGSLGAFMVPEYLDLFLISPRFIHDFPKLVLNRFALWNQRNNFLPDLLVGKRPRELSFHEGFVTDTLDIPNETLTSTGYRYSGTFKEEFQLKQNAEYRAAKYTAIMSDSVKEENKRALGEFLSFCQANQIECVLFSAPVSKYYLDYFGEDNLRSFFKDLSEVVGKFEGIRYLNFLSDPRYSNSQYFFDADHLNWLGSKKFTQDLNRIILSQ